MTKNKTLVALILSTTVLTSAPSFASDTDEESGCMSCMRSCFRHATSQAFHDKVISFVDTFGTLVLSEDVKNSLVQSLELASDLTENAQSFLGQIQDLSSMNFNLTLPQKQQLLELISKVGPRLSEKALGEVKEKYPELTQVFDFIETLQDIKKRSEFSSFRHPDGKVDVERVFANITGDKMKTLVTFVKEIYTLANKNALEDNTPQPVASSSDVEVIVATADEASAEPTA